MPLPRLDVRPGRLPQGRAALGPRAGLRQERVLAAPGAGRHLGAVRLRQPVPVRRASERDLGVSCRADRKGRHRRGRAPLPPPQRVRGGRELEGRVRELPRVLPLPGRASRLQRRHRHVAGRLQARGAETFLESVHDRARGGARRYDPHGEIEYGQFHLVWPNFVINVAPGRPNLSIGPINPVGPERTARFLDYLFGEDVDEEWIRAWWRSTTRWGSETRARRVSAARARLQNGRAWTAALEREHLVHDFQRRVAEPAAQG